MAHHINNIEIKSNKIQKQHVSSMERKSLVVQYLTFLINRGFIIQYVLGYVVPILSMCVVKYLQSTYIKRSTYTCRLPLDKLTHYTTS